MSEYKPPTNFEDYNRLCHERNVVDGYGMNVSMCLACPGCAAAGFNKYRIMHSEEDMQKEATCKECGRSFKCIITHPDENETRLEVVQTGGPDIPDWLAEKWPIRRV